MLTVCARSGQGSINTKFAIMYHLKYRNNLSKFIVPDAKSNKWLPFFFDGESTFTAGFDSEGASTNDGLGRWSASNIDEIWGCSRGGSRSSAAEAALLICLHRALGLGFTMVQTVSPMEASFSTSLMRLSSLGITRKWVFSDGVIVAVLGWWSDLSLLLT